MMVMVFRLIGDRLIYLGLALFLVVSPALFFWFFLSFLFLSLLHVVEVRVICSGSIAFIEETALWHLCVLCKSLCPAQKIDAEMVELATSKDE